jgi:hypothetical protein
MSSSIRLNRPVGYASTEHWHLPHGVTLIGRLFEEGPMVNAGIALERALGVVGERAPGF